MRLRFYRFMESVFSYPAAFFRDLSDEIDTELHQILKKEMKDIQNRELSRHSPPLHVDNENGVNKEFPACTVCGDLCNRDCQF